MKKYLFFRVLRSIVSIFLVTTIAYIMVFSMVPRRDIFKQDPMIQKLANDPDSLTDYKENAYRKMNYIDYFDTKSLIAKVEAEHPDAKVTTAHTAANAKLFKEWANDNGYKLNRYSVSKNYYVTRELPLLERLGRFYGNLIQIDTPWAIHDKSNPKLARYLRIENDKTVGWAVVGSGTRYRYQIYFNGSFPFIHQNIIKFNLGTSYPTFAGNAVTDVIGGRQGQTVSTKYKFPNGQVMNTADNVYTRQYQSPSRRNQMSYERYEDDYTNVDQVNQDPSMIGTSVRAGFWALILSYVIGIPIALGMARLKGKWFDRLFTGVVTVLMAVPGLALIYTFRYVLSVAGAPDSFPTKGASAFSSWVGPTVVLALLSVSGIVIWFRRYMVDQQQSDYVKFAKSKGLTDREIYRKHIFKNASIPVVQGIPSNIIGLISGAMMTETVFAMPGMGKMLPDSIIAHNNSVVIALVFIFTTIGVFSVLLGDVLMSIVDPRIQLAVSGDEQNG
ncbi:MAG: ABC transporter permease [Schleiferilactobacillus perolens]|uniref:Oligopeptide transport system permease protein AmiC n=1 Tax=Schleiferilactobacillus perolens DSM 12744 TaxID=1423792 RepID=A0A0R1N8H0_9LACO|nr:ABC transporter permease [Schleiferilactobacillus perolens]KRL13802.1 oligopeptide transport system permease protein AmiC [Schleiferilactobacillus perolens DSM 12744]